MLSNLNPLSNNHTLKLKMVSIWRKMMHGRKTETFRMDMICMDEEGHMIQASCLHRILPKFEHHFILDECLLITRPSLGPTNASINYTKNAQKLTFNFYTQIQKYFLGFVEVCFNLQDANKDGTKGKRLNIKLKDLEGQQVIGTLWDDFAIEMHAYFNDPKRAKYVVVVVHFGVVNLYKEKRGVSSSFDISRMFIDSEINEDELLNNAGFILSSYLSTISKPKKVILVGTITAICSDKLWYYNACNHCKSGVEETFVTIDKEDGSGGLEDKKTGLCTNADCKAVDIVSYPRYKIPIRVQDSDGTVTLTLFDFEAYKIFKKTAKELVQMQEEELASDGVPKPYPHVFDKLIGQNLLLSSMCLGLTLSIKLRIMVFQCSHQIQILFLHYTLNSKFMSTRSHIHLAFKCLTFEVKRNLHEVYDVDDTIGCSGTKRLVSDAKDEAQNSESAKLLIPKIEK